ncbi:hypothetical protein QYE76_031714 [Lolium multiflorum]|uniref:TF-B3 domain-containing protein n=1 Tax=Lolium multiflorum TaxID=4521 RepID=A0AAD8QSB0_LOLMU|nr:hypothetical protein QYE76_031714 [Lolium multiflorum]
MGELLTEHDGGGGVDGDGFRGHFPVPAACRNRDSVLLSLFFVHIHLIHCHGFHVSDADRKGKGKGKGSGSSSLPPPPSTLPLIIEEFFIVVYEDPLVKKVRTPKKFADYLDGQEPAKVYLRAADCGPRLWTVEVLFDGQGRMYLDKGWGNSAIAHGVDFGCYVHFKYEGDDVLIVKVFDGTMCRRYYYSDDEDTTMKAMTT